SPYQELLLGWPRVVYEAASTVDGLHFAIGYHFWCVFFGELREKRAWKFGLYILYPWALLVTAERLVFEICPHLAFLDSHPRLVDFSNSWIDSFYFVALAGVCSLITYRYFRVQCPEDRRRARWIVVGSAIGILPYAVLRLVALVADHTGQWLTPEAYQMGRRLGSLSSIAIPLVTG